MMHDEGKHRDDNAGGSEPPDDVDFFGHGQHRPFWSCDTTAAPTLTRIPPIHVSSRLKARNSSRIDPAQDHGTAHGRTVVCNHDLTPGSTKRTAAGSDHD